MRRYSVGNERPFLMGTCPLRVKRQNTLKEQILSAVAPATDIDSLAMVLRGSGRPGLWIECHSDYLPKDHPDPFEVSFQSARATSEFQLLSGREPTRPLRSVLQSTAKSGSKEPSSAPISEGYREVDRQPVPSDRRLNGSGRDSIASSEMKTRLRVASALALCMTALPIWLIEDVSFYLATLSSPKDRRSFLICSYGCCGFPAFARAAYYGRPLRASREARPWSSRVPAWVVAIGSCKICRNA